MVTDEAHRATVRAIVAKSSPGHALLQAVASMESAWSELASIYRTAIGKALGPAYDPHGSIDMHCDGCGAEVMPLRNQGGRYLCRQCQRGD